MPSGLFEGITPVFLEPTFVGCIELRGTSNSTNRPLPKAPVSADAVFDDPKGAIST